LPTAAVDPTTVTDMRPEDYYAEHAEREWERLEETPVKRLEFEGTVETLAEELPETGRVLDAGGGPGRYSIWLAERGYDVSYVDLTPELVDVARERAGEAGVADRIDHGQADVRDLPHDDDAFDAVCCLGGVLSHVVDAAERRRAVGELRRVAQPGAPVFVSVIGRLGGVRDGIKNNARNDGSSADWDVIEHVARTGDYTTEVVERYGADAGWAANHTFRVAELESLLSDAGLAPDSVVALEGLASTLHDELEDAPDHAVDNVREIARELRHDRAAADVSEHFMVVARA
jgi:SAM-dependent methyltransferase